MIDDCSCTRAQRVAWWWFITLPPKKLRTVDKEQKFYKLTQLIEDEDMAGTINSKRKPCGWNDKY